MTLLVRDEEDVIRENLEHHLSMGIDHIVVTDNKSVDRTPSILREYARRGVVDYIFEGSDDYSQDLWVTRMAGVAARDHAADWIIHTDADEFLRADRPLRDMLSNVPDDVDGMFIDRHNFVCTPDDSRPFYERMIYRQTISTNTSGQTLPPKVMHRGFNDVRVWQGNHGFSLGDGSVKPTIQESSMAFLHFPVRTIAQLVRKIRYGGAAYERNQRLDRNIGSTWRDLYQIEKQLPGGLARFAEENLYYSDQDIAEAIADGTIFKDTEFRERMTQTMQRVR